MVAAMLVTILTFGQNFSLTQLQPTASLPAASVHPAYLTADRSQFASIEKMDVMSDLSLVAPRGGERDCGHYKKGQTIGIVLASIGGGLLITGIALEVVAVNDVANGDGSLNDVGLYAGGAVLIIGGLGCAGAGIPIAIINSVKLHKYCGKDKASRSYMQLSTNGHNLALNF